MMVVLVFGILFSLLYVAHALQGPMVVTVIIPEGSSLALSERNNFEPSIVKVVIGVKNTVRRENQDVTLHNVIASGNDDPIFYDATKIQCENNDYDNCVVIPSKKYLTIIWFHTPICKGRS
jgi:hypothetical protein